MKRGKKGERESKREDKRKKRESNTIHTRIYSQNTKH